ncbi:hypothetical protein MCUN1_000195 [Malassezia cuniculi]|uniref:Transmembrane protein 135 N-terminal domain-containing protein n=1 Tax=Malassezia cuniculi TaxID=948313 RepID=A0AAF0EUV9_9BASI|nr:hypothetical protein MCUN1_000195 [Malassezia cuniculi]
MTTPTERDIDAVTQKVESPKSLKPHIDLPKPGAPLSNAGSGENNNNDDDDDDDEEMAAWRRLASGPTTPNITEAMANLKRNLSISGLQEFASRPTAEVRRTIKNKLWRPQNETAKIPQDWERLAVHVARGGARAFVIAYGLRSLMSFLFALIGSVRSRTLHRNAIRDAFFGEHTARFALTFGVWAALYKAVHNSLRLLTPPPQGKARARATFDAHGNSQPTAPSPKPKDKWSQQRFLFRPDPRSKVWHAYVAGAVSSLALLLQDNSFYRGFAPQLFVRGLEGVVHTARGHGYFNVPHGETLLFGIANLFIISAWLSHDHHLPGSYKRWIDKASKIPLPFKDAYKSSANGYGADPWNMAKLFPGGQMPEPLSTDPLKFAPAAPTKHNAHGIQPEILSQFHRWFESGDPDRLPCGLSHPYSSNHLRTTFDNFYLSWKWIMPVYLTLYVVPSLFLRPAAFMKNPMASLKRSLFGASRSSAFLAAYIVIIKGSFCLTHSFYETVYFSPKLRAIPGLFTLARLVSDDKFNMVTGFSSCLSVLIEPRHRRGELTLYVLPKALQTFWATGRSKGLLPHVPGGDFILTAAGLSLIMGTYATNPENLSRIVSRVIYQFVGRN